MRGMARGQQLHFSARSNSPAVDCVPFHPRRACAQATEEGPTSKLRYKYLAPVVRRVDRAFHWINYYPLDNSIGFASVYPLHSALSGG